MDKSPGGKSTGNEYLPARFHGLHQFLQRPPDTAHHDQNLHARTARPLFANQSQSTGPNTVIFTIKMILINFTRDICH